MFYIRAVTIVLIHRHLASGSLQFRRRGSPHHAAQGPTPREI
jgi:hypothetical protein